MANLWLIKIGEISLKKGNRAYFERLLKENIKRRFADIGAQTQITIRSGRYYLETELEESRVSAILASTPGINAFSRARKVKKNLDALLDASLETARECLGRGSGMRFKFEVRRVDKSLPLNCYDYARELGAMLLGAVPGLKVDVHNPDFVIRVELREWGYVYEDQRPGTGGLPVGSGGRGMLLLSGGIDSPVAGYLMARRGLTLTAIHFHTPPYTSGESHDKVLRLAAALAPCCGGITLLTVPFTDCQVRLSRAVDTPALTLHSRACMMRIAELCARQRRCGALITGESLGQVASQTLESMAYTDQSVALPVFRPLVGMDKEQIIHYARAIGSYDISIEPFADCCSLFSPENPLTRPNVAEQREKFAAVEGLEALMAEAAGNAAEARFNSHGVKIGDD
ncbi:MAG: tRNA 4-thiouridine(8) synthase ThiI [Spirochaeta sp. LUC14_002_19_P3]|nr:MAG: tRNA 4-thiouridine(8) synthase ThiI [Spirochaeta sp. LUC14_002_19_P3]